MDIYRHCGRAGEVAGNRKADIGKGVADCAVERAVDVAVFGGHRQAKHHGIVVSADELDPECLGEQITVKESSCAIL